MSLGTSYKRFLYTMVPILVLQYSYAPAFADDKWLVYTRPPGDYPSASYLYLGYKTFLETDQQLDDEKIKDIRDHVKSLTHGKPIINEQDDVRVLVFTKSSENLVCKIEQTAFRVPDVKVSPPVQALAALKEGTDKTPTEVTFLCNLLVRDKGGMEIKYTISTPSKPPDADTVRLQDAVHVHDLYRFRVMAGPGKTLSQQPRTFKVITNTSGQNIVSSSPAHDSPVDFPLLLKVFWAPRDTLLDPSWDLSTVAEPSCSKPTQTTPPKISFLCRVNPIVGVNLVESPLKNFYVGLSFEIVRGFDVVGGVHWSKNQHLTGGFFEGQVTTASAVPTRDRFDSAWFIGTAVDIGVIGAWLKNNVAPVFTGK